MRLLILALSAGVCGAGGAGEAFAQAVQLPTFHSFSVGTTVSVPDRGGAYLGGVRRAASGRTSHGAPLVGKTPGLGRLGRNEAIGSTVGAAGVGVTATIIDQRALDAAVLAEARAGRAADDSRAAAALGAMSPPVVASPATRRFHAPAESPPLMSVAELRRQHEAQDQTLHQEALALMEKGRQAEAARKFGSARIYYQMAARRGDDALRRQIEARLAAVR